MMRVDAFLTNCRLADGRLVDIGITGGKIVVVGEGAAASSNSAPALEIGGVFRVAAALAQRRIHIAALLRHE